MQAREVVCDGDAFRWHVSPVDDSPAGLFRLQTAVERMFPGVNISRGTKVEGELCFALGGYSGKHNLDMLDTDTFNQLVGEFDPVKKVAAAGPFEVQAMLTFEPTKEFCDQLAMHLSGGVSRVAKSPLHPCLLSLTVDDLDGDTEHALTVDDVRNELRHLLCCVG